MRNLSTRDRGVITSRLTGAAVLTLLLYLSLSLQTPAPAQAQDLTGEVKDMTWIGFKQFKEVSRVFIRTTEPVNYRIDTSRADMVVLLLENTQIPLLNNRRPLHTHFFDSPIRLIQAKIIEGTSPSVRVEIHVREKVPIRDKQDDNVLSLDFQRVAE